MSIKILRVTDKSQLIIFLLISILLHIGILMIVPNTREGKKTLPRPIPIDVIELPQPVEIKKPSTSGGTGEQPHPLLPSVLPFAEEKRIAEPLLPANPPTHLSDEFPAPFDKGEQKGDFDKEAGLQLQQSTATESGGLEEKTEQEPAIKKESVEDEKPLPSEPILKEEKPLSLYPTKERIAELSKKYEKEAPVGEKDRDISFDTSEPRYTSYFEGLKAKIYHEWEYPDAAASGGQAGRLFVNFVILKDGTLEDVTLIRSSGYPMLDNAAISAIRLAAPFYPFQKSFGSLEKITVNASFEYILYPYINRQKR